MSSRSYSKDENGNITQIDSTRDRPDGKTETLHIDPNSGNITGKTVNNPDTGTSKSYDRTGGGGGVLGYTQR
jgi:hypothetical protein